MITEKDLKNIKFTRYTEAFLNQVKIEIRCEYKGNVIIHSRKFPYINGVIVEPPWKLLIDDVLKELNAKESINNV